MELPIKVNGIVYKLNESNEYEILVLKRSQKDGGFWQTVTGTLNEGEFLEDCLIRELEEETNILRKDILNIKPDIHKFHWNKNETPINEYVYGIEVKNDIEVKLSFEHDEYKWLTVNNAINIVKTDNNKESIERLKKYL